MKWLSLLSVSFLAASSFAQEAGGDAPQEPATEPAAAPAEAAPAFGDLPSDAAEEPPAVDPEAKPADGKPEDGAEKKEGEAKDGDAEKDAATEDGKKKDADGKDGEAKKEEKKKLPFIKGNLTSAGATVRIPQRSEYGVSIGIDTIGDDIFLKVSPQIHLIKKNWRLGFHLPLRAPLYSATNTGTTLINDQQFTIRPEDYDQTEDFLAAILYAQYGKKEDPIFLSASRVGAATLGHGTILRRFNPNLTTDTTYTSVSLDAYSKHGGFQAFASSVPNPYLWGALAFIKPVGAIQQGDKQKSPAGLRSLSIGFTHVQDGQAPTALDTFCADGNVTCDTRTVRLDSANGFLPVVTGTGVVSASGIDVEYKFYKSQDAKTDLKTYADISYLGVDGDVAGMGTALGFLARLNFGTGKNTTAMRFRAEGRMFDAKFVPTYFDSLYAQQRYQFVSGGAATGNEPTKMTWLQGLASDADADKQRMGYFIDLAYAKPRSFGLQASYENASISGGDNSDNRYQHLMVHAEMPLLFLEVFGTYHLRGFADFGQAFQLNANNEILVGAVRWKLFPFLAFNIKAQKSFSTAAYGEGVNSQIRQSEVVGGFRNLWDYSVDCQIGAHY